MENFANAAAAALEALAELNDEVLTSPAITALLDPTVELLRLLAGPDYPADSLIETDLGVEAPPAAYALQILLTINYPADAQFLREQYREAAEHLSND